MYTDIHYLMSCFNCIILVNHADIIDSSLHHVSVYIYMQITYMIQLCISNWTNIYIYIIGVIVTQKIPRVHTININKSHNTQFCNSLLEITYVTTEFYINCKNLALKMFMPGIFSPTPFKFYTSYFALRIFFYNQSQGLGGGGDLFQKLMKMHIF